MRQPLVFFAIFRVAFIEAVAYRSSLVIFVLGASLSLVMLLLWLSVTSVAPVAGQITSWGSSNIITYFLCVYVVRQLIINWCSWQINAEVRQGTLAARLLRPVHPIVVFGANSLGSLPVRAAVVLPVVAFLLFSDAAAPLTHDPLTWGLTALALIGSWAIVFFLNVFFGALSLFLDSSLKMMDVWFLTSFVFSGYLYPIDLLPEWLQWSGAWLPFRYQMGFAVELMLGLHSSTIAVELVAKQWVWVGAFAAAAIATWQIGIRRFQAHGG